MNKFSIFTEFLFDELMYIDMILEIHTFLKNQHVDKVDLLNIAPAFFGATENALLESGTIRLYKLFDSDNNAITVPKYLNYIEQNLKNIYGKDATNNIKKLLKEDRTLLDEYKQSISKLKVVRDKSLAHNDPKYSLKAKDIWADAGVTYGDIHKLIKISGEVVNHYYGYGNDKYRCITAVNRLDVERVISALERFKTNKF